MRARSATIGWPPMSLPSASVNGDLSSSYACDLTISPSATISRTSFGISRPTYGLPGMISTTRTLTVASERARSFARLLIWLLFTPAAGLSSKRVTTGPGCTATTSASTPKSLSLSSTSRDIASSASGE